MRGTSILAKYVIAGTLLWASVASACPPPPPPPLFVAPDRAAGEDDIAYFDRLAEARRISYLPQPRGLEESEEQFRARSANFERLFREAAERQYRRDIEAALAQALRVETESWASAHQILLARFVRYDLNHDQRGRWVDARFQLIDTARGHRGAREFTLRYPDYGGMSCAPQPPGFHRQPLTVIFANAGPVTTENMIGFYNAETARDPRTQRWLDGTRPDGRPVPRQRQ